MAFFWSPQLPVASEYLRPLVIVECLTALSKVNGLFVSTHCGVSLAWWTTAHLLEIAIDVLGELAEEHPEERAEERAGEVETLAAKVIAVVDLAALEDGEEQAVDHVAEEEGCGVSRR